jgi:hypothetical protein
MIALWSYTKSRVDSLYRATFSCSLNELVAIPVIKSQCIADNCGSMEEKWSGKVTRWNVFRHRDDKHINVVYVVIFGKVGSQLL